MYRSKNLNRCVETSTLKDNPETQDGGSFLVNLECTLSNRPVNFAVVGDQALFYIV